MLSRMMIRQETVARLKGKTAAGDRVYSSRVPPVNPKDFPVLLCYTTKDHWASASPHGVPKFNEVVTMSIEAAVLAGEGVGLEDEADALAEEAVDLLLTDVIWLKLFDSVEDITSESVIAEARGFRMIGVRLDLKINAGLSVWQPVIPDRLGTVAVDVDCIEPSDPNNGPTGPDGRPEVQTLIILPE